VAVAALVRLVYAPWYGNYDVRYALLWARDILHGHNPDYGAAFAPTPHPLSITWSTIGLPFGDSGGSVMVMVALTISSLRLPSVMVTSVSAIAAAAPPSV